MSTRKLFRIAAAALLLTGCSSAGGGAPDSPDLVGSTRVGGLSTPRGTSADLPVLTLTEVAESPDYGYTPTEPIVLGTGDPTDSIARTRLYLSSLRGPEGQALSYQRNGSCCPFETDYWELGGLLDVYEVTWEGRRKPLLLFVNIYDRGDPLIPQKLTAGR